MQQRLLAELHGLEQALDSAGSPIIAHFRPGLTRERLLAMSREAGVAITEDIITLYGWHDGTESTGDFYDSPSRCLIGEWGFLSLEEALEWKRDGLHSGVADLLGWDVSRVLPFMGERRDVLMLGYALLSDQDAQVWLGYLEDLSHTTFGTVTDFVTVLRLGWERGLIAVDSDGEFVRHDILALRALMAELNIPWNTFS